MFSLTLARKSYARNLQYRSAHLMRMFASVIIGYIYMAIWMGVGEGQLLGDYGIHGMISYIAFNQACLWVIMATNWTDIEGWVRTGQISHELMKPMHFFWYMHSREWGQTWYQFLYSTTPILIIYIVVLKIRTPEHSVTWLWTLLAMFLAAYIAICIAYLIGIAAFWTTESRWLNGVHMGLNMLLSGFFIPVEWLPGWLKMISILSPYPCLQYVPSRIYLELDPAHSLKLSLFWCLLLTAICFTVTRVIRRKVEVQGG
ncbi:ABC transporter permease [Paenibacillus pinihumi]|uniref:ABC transporter permease n=1 Tax=Paenibacillus pinihumi TaxID=669462 RepID=UPI000420B806|nr:ABC-2 family transporter protein [Paenibacillus pinihumi]